MNKKGFLKYISSSNTKNAKKPDKIKSVYGIMALEIKETMQKNLFPFFVKYLTLTRAVMVYLHFKYICYITYICITFFCNYKNNAC